MFKSLLPILALLLLLPISLRELAKPKQQAGIAAVEQAARVPITRQISSTLTRQNKAAFSELAVHESDGIVTLIGTVPTLRDHDTVIQVAEGVRGVRSIVDRVRLAPAVISDGSIRERVAAAIRNDPVTRRAWAEVNVTNGAITLTGKAPSWASREMSAWVAKGVPGVTAVQNNLAVDPGAPRSAGDIAQEIRAKISRDPWLAGTRLDVSVDGGEVRLRGTVPALADKERIRLHAFASGGGMVDLTQVNLERLERQQAGTIPPLEAPILSDEKLKLAVKDALAVDPRLDGSGPGVAIEVHHGVVTLKGGVENFRAYDAAESDARNTIGVFSVINELRVRPAAQRPDRDIAQDTQDAFSAEPNLKGAEITFQVSNGLVVINDSKANAEQRQIARQLAGSVPGVVGVRESNFKTSGQEAGADTVMQGAIERSIETNPLILANDRITVRVSNATATLTGSVETMAAKMSLSRDALSAGATRVNNRVRVRVEDGRQARLLPNEPGRPSIWEYPFNPA